MMLRNRQLTSNHVDCMPDETNETSSVKTSPAKSEKFENTASISQGIGLCAAIIALSFFLPWINFLGFKLSGFDFTQKSGGASFLLWVVPFFGIVALTASITKTNLKTAACLAGIAPLIVLGYGFTDSGADLLKMLDVGGYIAIVAAFCMLILPARLK